MNNKLHIVQDSFAFLPLNQINLGGQLFSEKKRKHWEKNVQHEIILTGWEVKCLFSIFNTDSKSFVRIFSGFFWSASVGVTWIFSVNSCWKDIPMTPISVTAVHSVNILCPVSPGCLCKWKLYQLDCALSFCFSLDGSICLKEFPLDTLVSYRSNNKGSRKIVLGIRNSYP